MVMWARAVRVHAALLAGGVLLVALQTGTSDIAFVREREIAGNGGFEYPVLVRPLYLAERAITGSVAGIAIVNALLAVTVAVVVTVALRRIGADVGTWAMAPTLLLVGQNVDAITALLVVGVWRAWDRGRIRSAGALAGIGAAFKIAPAASLPALLADPNAKWRHCVAAMATAAGVWVVANVPYAVLAYDAWAFPFRFASQRRDTRGTIWAALPLEGTALNVASAFAGALVVAAVAVSVRHRRLTPITGVALSLLGFVITNKVWQPHYLLWLLPVLAVLSTPRRSIRLLEAANLAFFVALFLEVEDDVTVVLYWATGGARIVAAVLLAWVLVRSDPLACHRRAPSTSR
jgi:uncharacterized membrane protein